MSQIEVSSDYICETISQKIYRANRTHLCNECWNLINPGDKYERYVGKDTSCELFSHKTCASCLSMRAVFFPTYYNFGEIWGDLRDHIFDEMEVVKEAELEGLLFPAKQKIQLLNTDWLEHCRES